MNKFYDGEVESLLSIFGWVAYHIGSSQYSFFPFTQSQLLWQLRRWRHRKNGVEWRETRGRRKQLAINPVYTIIRRHYFYPLLWKNFVNWVTKADACDHTADTTRLDRMNCKQIQIRRRLNSPCATGENVATWRDATRRSRSVTSRRRCGLGFGLSLQCC